MDPVRLVEGYKSIMRTIYSPREYYQRALDCLKRLPQGGRESRGSNLLSDLLTLVRILFVLGVRDHARGEFWRYMSRIFADHRKQFARGVMLAAMGYHLRKMTDAYCG